MALIEKLNAIGDAIRAKTGGSDKLTLDQMPTEIASISSGGGSIEVEPIVLTGKQERSCGGLIASTYIKLFGNTMSTLDLTDADEMFKEFTGEYIPFDLNFTKTKDGAHYISNLFNGCSNLKELPKINNIYIGQNTAIQYTFYQCRNLRVIPDDYFDNWVFATNIGSYTRFNGIFSNCMSLRSMPLAWLKNLPAGSSNTSTFYYEGFYYCYALDELVNIPVPYTVNEITGNSFNQTFDNCYRLKNITFETNEDGTPKVVKWKSQTIDLNKNVGYSTLNAYLTSYNSGITADKEVSGIEQYHNLKNDPDWFTCNQFYSRYNHDSAVETINSLPDTSAYLASAGGTNTIKFRGVSGQNTDGGAINTLTEEEIAVATAKGWTVSFV